MGKPYQSGPHHSLARRFERDYLRGNAVRVESHYRPYRRASRLAANSKALANLNRPSYVHSYCPRLSQPYRKNVTTYLLKIIMTQDATSPLGNLIL